MPKGHFPNFEFTVDEYVKTYFSMESVKFKPEAPWLNRVNGIVQFTEELNENGSNTVSVTDRSEYEEPPKVEEDMDEPRKYFSLINLANI